MGRVRVGNDAPLGSQIFRLSLAPVSVLHAITGGYIHSLGDP